MEGGKDLAESAKEMERMRKTMASQLSDFEAMKKSLVRDLQNRCEKVCTCEEPFPPFLFLQGVRRTGLRARDLSGRNPRPVQQRSQEQ